MNPSIHQDNFDASPDADLLAIFQRTAAAPSRDAHQILLSSGDEKSKSPLRRRISLRWVMSAAAFLLAVAAVGTWWSAPSRALWAQAAAQIHQASSVRCRVVATIENPGGDGHPALVQKSEGTMRWVKSGSHRHEMKGSEQDYVHLRLADQPGIEIDHRTKSFRRTAPLQGSRPPLITTFERLATFRGEPNQDLGDSEIDGRKVHAFEIDLAEFDADVASPGKVRVWVDNETKRVARVEFEFRMLERRQIMTFDQFVWNERADDWFAVTPPGGYANRTPVPESLEKMTQHIVASLRIYAKYSGGEYPKVKLLYGDEVSAKLAKLAGVDDIFGRKIDDAARKRMNGEQFQDHVKAGDGFGFITRLQRDNPDAAYFGKTVTPKDKDRVLFRWRLETGEYQVLFGDLSHRIVAKDELIALEGK